MSLEPTINEQIALANQNFAKIDEQADKFTAILNLNSCIIDIRLGVATAINGVDRTQKASIAIDKNVLPLFIENLKLSLQSDLEIQEADKFIDLLKLPYCIIQVNQGLAESVNGLDKRQNSHLAIETSMLLLFIVNFKAKLQAKFDIQIAALEALAA